MVGNEAMWRWARTAMLGLMGAALMMLASPAFAQSCGDDMQKLQGERAAALQTINKMAAAAKGKPLNADQFCAGARPLTAADAKLFAYMTKNKDWCQIPDDIIAQFTSARAKDSAMAGKACSVAAQMRKAQQQGGAGGGPPPQPLPAGPL